jgi:hypothetical protein
MSSDPTTPIEFNARVPKILATVTIDPDTTGSTLQELLSTDITLSKDVLIKNNSDDDLTIRFNNSQIPNNNITTLLGRSSIRIKTNSLRAISLSKTGSKNLSVSIYGR